MNVTSLLLSHSAARGSCLAGLICILTAIAPAKCEATYYGTHVSISFPSSVSPGSSLNGTVTVRNTGSSGWYNFIDPNWIIHAYNFSWNPPFIAIDKWVYPWVNPAQTVSEPFTLLAGDLPSAPGTYSFQIACYHPMNGFEDGNYLLMTSSPRTITFTIPAPGPTVSSFSPGSGPIGTVVNIYGSGFTGVSAVRFNGWNASYTVINSGQIRATVPTNATTGPIAVTASDLTRSSSANFTVLPRPALTSPVRTANSFRVSTMTSPGQTYELRYVAAAGNTNWIAIPSSRVTGDGTLKTLIDPDPASPCRLYRVFMNP